MIPPQQWPLPAAVDNAQLELAFSQFGNVERAIVAATHTGSSAGYGFVDFRSRNHAELAVKLCGEGPFLLAMDPRPVVVEPAWYRDTVDGVSHSPDRVAREQENSSFRARFSQSGTPIAHAAASWQPRALSGGVVHGAAKPTQ